MRDDDESRVASPVQHFQNGKLPIDDELFKLRARDGTRGEGLPERDDDARRRRRRREEEENNDGLGERAGRRGRRRRGIRATDAKETTGTAEKWYVRSDNFDGGPVVFGGRNHRTCDDGLFYFRTEESEKEMRKKTMFLCIRSLASRVFLRLLLLRRRRLPFLVYYYLRLSNTYFLITNKQRKNSGSRWNGSATDLTTPSRRKNF